MATTKPTPKPLPPDVLRAIEDGTLTQTQLTKLIAFEAATLGLEYEEAVSRAREDTLPRNTTGTDLRLLVSLLAT